MADLLTHAERVELAYRREQAEKAARARHPGARHLQDAIRHEKRIRAARLREQARQLEDTDG